MKSPQGTMHEESPQEFQERLGIQFSNISLLTRALTHRSYINEHPEALEDNERLEFLGDAVLDFVVGAWLYHHFPEMKEGSLTQLRTALVRTETLAAFARDIELDRAIRLGEGEELSGGRERTGILCATFEAFIGGYYLDRGIRAVEDFLEPFLEDAVEDVLENRQHRDPKSLLQEWAQARGLNAPTYRTVSARGPDHAKIFEVEVLVQGQTKGWGQGRSKREAAKHAARMALERFRSERG
ncbi:MAG: ribonuclease III [Anaerolineales bacterium]